MSKTNEGVLQLRAKVNSDCKLCLVRVDALPRGVLLSRPFFMIGSTEVQVTTIRLSEGDINAIRKTG